MFKAKSLKYLLFAVFSLFFSTVSYADSPKAQVEVLQPKNLFKAFPPGRSFLYNGIDLGYNEKSTFLDAQNAIFVILEIYHKDGVMGVQKLSQDCYQRPSVPVTCYFIDMAGLVLLEQIELEKYEVIQTDYFSRQNVLKRSETIFQLFGEIENKSWTERQKLESLFRLYYDYSDWIDVFKLKKFEPKE